MTDGARAAVETAHRDEWGRGGHADRVTGDGDLAEVAAAVVLGGVR
jgi:hypothetical protein